MTIQTTSSKAGPFIGNGATTGFTCNFLIDKPDDLQVIYTNAIQQDVVLDPSQYLASGFGDPAGVTVTYPIAGQPIGAGEKITLLRLVDYDQQTSITNQGGFYPQVIEKALDRIVMQCQQLAEKVGRAVSVSVSSGEDPNAAFQSIAVNAAIAQEAASEAGGSANAAAASAAAAAASAASIEQPLPVASGGTGAETAEDARNNLGLTIGTSAGNIPQLQIGGKMPSLDAINMFNTGRLIKMSIISSLTSYTPDPATKKILVRVQGGGAGGGSSGTTSASQTSSAGGGGGGGNTFDIYDVATLTFPILVTPGAGGNGGAAGPNDGVAGGNTTFGSLLTANGGGVGRGGNLVSGGSGTSALASVGGSSSGGKLNLQGGGGGYALATAPNQTPSGMGGSSFYGQGGASAINNNGFPGVNPGSGGGGGASGPSNPGRAGGNGAAGMVEIWEFA